MVEHYRSVLNGLPRQALRAFLAMTGKLEYVRRNPLYLPRRRRRLLEWIHSHDVLNPIRAGLVLSMSKFNMLYISCRLELLSLQCSMK